MPATFTWLILSYLNKKILITINKKIFSTYYKRMLPLWVFDHDEKNFDQKIFLKDYADNIPKLHYQSSFETNDFKKK
jgi:hypothetical protein